MTEHVTAGGRCFRRNLRYRESYRMFWAKWQDTRWRLPVPAEQMQACMQKDRRLIFIWERNGMRIKFYFIWIQYLPEDIAVCEVKRVDERFHSRYQAVEKTYLYRIHTGKIPEVFERRYVYDYTEPLDVNRMRKAASTCVEHMILNHSAAIKKWKNPRFGRSPRIQIKELPGEIQIYYTGNGFLQNMVRILTGTLIEIGDGRRTPEDVSEILEAKNRERAGYTAPACGLTLLEVIYGKMVCNK